MSARVASIVSTRRFFHTVRRPVLHVLRLLRAEGHFIRRADVRAASGGRSRPDGRDRPAAARGRRIRAYVTRQTRGGRGPDRDDQRRMLLRRGQLLRPHVHSVRAGRRRGEGYREDCEGSPSRFRGPRPARDDRRRQLHDELSEGHRSATEGRDGGRPTPHRLPVFRGRGRLLLQPVPMRVRVGDRRPSVIAAMARRVLIAQSTRRYKCCVCSMCGCLLEWGICFGRRGGDGPCCFDCCWCPCCP